MDKIKIPNFEIAALIDSYKDLLGQFKKAKIDAGESTEIIDAAEKVHNLDQQMINSQDAIYLVVKFGEECFELGKKAAADSSIVYSERIAI